MNHTQNQMIQNSIQTNIENFLKDFSDIEAYQLCMYLGSRYMTQEPTQKQAEFLDEFFDLDEWKRYVKAEKEISLSNELVMFRPVFDLNSVRTVLMFVVLQRIPNILKDISKLKVKEANKKLKQLELKAKLLGAVHDSYYDGVFDKCDGWCNIADVLVEAKLLKLPKENDD